MSAFHWILMLMIGAGVLAVLEIFVPSGGILGAMALLLFLSAVLVVGFHFGAVIGFLALAASLVALPLLVMWVLKWWPRTAMGRRFLLQAPSESEVLPQRALRDLVGKIGRAKTVMLPSGAAEIEGRLVNAISEGLPIESGQLVRVVAVQGNSVIVQPADEVPEEQRAPDDLSRSIESLGLDPLDDAS